MRKRPGWEWRGGFLLLAASLLAGAVSGEGADPAATGPVPAQSHGTRSISDPSPGARTVLPLVAKLWASGFFKRNEAVERELLNNTYAFFDKNSPAPPKGRSGLGCFVSAQEGSDTIFLRRELFARFEVAMDGVQIFPDARSRALPVLVHEICHDLWLNVLDDAERASFAREGCGFMEDYRRAQTPEDRRMFLLRAGDDPADPRTLKTYAGIDAILETIPPRALRGHELFAWLAERLFTTRSPIPRPLSRYYSPILADPDAAPREP